MPNQSRQNPLDRIQSTYWLSSVCNHAPESVYEEINLHAKVLVIVASSHQSLGTLESAGAMDVNYDSVDTANWLNDCLS